MKPLVHTEELSLILERSPGAKPLACVGLNATYFKTNSLQIDYWHFKSCKIVTHQNNHKICCLCEVQLDYVDNLLENYS